MTYDQDFYEHTWRREPEGCVHCGFVADAATSADDIQRPPEPGDYSICIECGGWMMFGLDDRPGGPKVIRRLRLRKLTTDELAALVATVEFRQITGQWLAMQQEREQ